MKFTLNIRVDNPRKTTKDDVMEAVALFLNRNGYSFDVGYDPREIDIDKIGKA